jgi:hypothetical protein
LRSGSACPPFCLVVDWAVAAIIAAEIVAGVHFHH